VVRRPVTLGTLGQQSYVVERGLAAGDRIATSSLQALRDGAPIKPRDQRAAPVGSNTPEAPASATRL